MFTTEEIKNMPLEERKEVLKTRADLKKKKAEVVSKVKKIAKNGYNDHFKYKYATESDVKEGIRELLSEAGLTLDSNYLGDEKNGQETTVFMEFVLTDNDTGYFEVTTSKGVATDKGDKGLYKAFAGCIKYFLMNEFLIATGDDPEQGNDQEPNGGKGGRGRNNNGKNNGKNNYNNNRNNNNQGGDQGPPSKPAVNIKAVEAKWKQLAGSLDGFDDWKNKKEEEGKDLGWMDQTLLGKIQAKQAQERKAKEEAEKQKQNEDFDSDLSQIKEQSEQNKKTVTDVDSGKTAEFNGKPIHFE